MIRFFICSCWFLSIWAFSANGQVAVESQKFQIIDIGRITIPGAMELQSAEMQRDVDSAKRLFIPDSILRISKEKAVFQQAGLNNTTPESLTTYARVIIAEILGSDGDFGRSIDVKNATNEEMQEVNNLFKSETEKQLKNGLLGTKFISWYGVNRVQINGWMAIHFSYTRSVFDGLPVLVHVYRFHNNDRIYILTLSYRLQDEVRWKPVMNSIIHSFVITNIR
jgi:hypothetical protein